MNGPRLAVLALAVIVLGACVAQSSPEPSASATPGPTSTRPRFELATYMYALQTRGKIRVASLDKDAPFAVRDASGSRAGFEADLARELAKAIFGPQQNIDSVIEWVSVDPSSGVSTLASLQADVTIARLAATEERAAVIDLTDPYFVTGERLLVSSTNDEIKDVTDLPTKTVCVQRGSGVAERVDEANPAARTLELDTYASCLSALRAGQVDAIGADEMALWNLMRENADTRLVGAALTTERYAIGAKKNASDRNGFLPFLNTWLAGAIRDGTWGRLYAQHITPLSRDAKTSP